MHGTRPATRRRPTSRTGSSSGGSDARAFRWGDAFLRRVVPGIVAESPELAGEHADSSTPPSELLRLYLLINGQLRESNRDAIAALAAETATRQLWSGPFRQLANSQVESGFADHRTYLYDGNEIDQQVHLGFDLASTANAPVRAANTGTVIFAEYLGIYGRCVVIDHGMGLQSLYAHLSSLDVAPGMEVEARPADRPERADRPRRRRPPALRDAAPGPAGDPHGMVG